MTIAVTPNSTIAFNEYRNSRQVRSTSRLARATLPKGLTVQALPVR